MTTLFGILQNANLGGKLILKMDKCAIILM
jgi:hypothetical protein